MAITPEQQHTIVQAHAEGHLDNAIARLAGVSLATVKRYRRRLGLETNCPINRRGRLGERLIYDEAVRRGLRAEWHERNSDTYDLYIEGQRVDAKASMQCPDGTWRFRLPETRTSFYGRYLYAKDYGADCELVALVALSADGCAPDFYFLDSATLPRDVRIRSGSVYDVFRNDWTPLCGDHPDHSDMV